MHRRYCAVLPLTVLISVCVSFVPVPGGYLAFVPVALTSSVLGFVVCILLLNGPLYATKEHSLLDRNLGPPVLISLVLFFAFLSSYIAITGVIRSAITGLLIPLGCQLAEFIVYQLNKRCFLLFYCRPQAEFHSRIGRNLRGGSNSETTNSMERGIPEAEISEVGCSGGNVHVAVRLEEQGNGVWSVDIDYALQELRGDIARCRECQHECRISDAVSAVTFARKFAADPLPNALQEADDAPAKEGLRSGQGIHPSSGFSSGLHRLDVPIPEQPSLEPPLLGDLSAVFANILISTGLIIDNAKLVAVLAEVVRNPDSRSWLVGIVVSAFLDVGKRSGGLHRLQMALLPSTDGELSRSDVESLEVRSQKNELASRVSSWLGDLIALTSLKAVFLRSKTGCSYVCGVQLVLFGCLRACALKDWHAALWIDLHAQLGLVLLTTIVVEILKDLSMYALGSQGLIRFPMCKQYAPEHPLGNTETRAMDWFGHFFVFMYGSFVVFGMLTCCMGTDFLFGVSHTPDMLSLSPMNDTSVFVVPAYNVNVS
jgi:hypothetical protein